MAGVDDFTLEPRVGIVRMPTIIWRDRFDVSLEDGRASEYSRGHRFAVVERGWVEVQNLCPGDLIVSNSPAVVKAVRFAGKGPVVTFQVEGTGTYLSDGLLSHNLKPIDPYA